MTYKEQNHSFEETRDEAIGMLKNAGLKLTKKRQEIIDIFARDQKYYRAIDIHDILSAENPTMSYNTTYRNLYDFTELGILEVTEYNQEQLFKISCFPDHHHHHFICTNCGKVIPIHACPMEKIETDLPGVKVQTHRFEVFGLCEECA